MSLLYVNIKNHENLQSPTPSKQVLQQPYKKDHNLKQNKFTIDPEKIILHYQLEKSIVEKIIFLNNHTQKISFIIEPPTKSVFSVKCKKSSLYPKQSCEIFLFFAGQKQKIILQDEFVIMIDKEKLQLHVPIICKPRIPKFSSNRRLSLHKNSSHFKENDSQTKQKLKSKPLVLKKKKTGLWDLNSEIESMVNGFMEKFNSIHEFVKQKNVKKQIFIGQKALSEEKHRKIIAFNERVRKHIETKIQRKVESRLDTQFSSQGPVIRNFDGLILRWNREKNIPKLVYDKGLSKVQEQVRKYLMNLRYEKIHRIFSIYREFKQSDQYINIPQQKKHEIYLEKLQKKVNKKSEASLELTFDRSSIIPSQLEVQNDVYSNRKSHTFEINPRIGFDNWIAIEESIPYTHEVMDYSKKQAIPEWLLHPKLQQFHLGTLSNGHTSSKVFYGNEKQSQQSSNEVNFLIQQIRTYGEAEEPPSSKQIQTINSNKTKSHLPSKGELNKINQAYNITGKIFSSMFSAKSLNFLPREDHKTEVRNLKAEKQALEDYLIEQNLKQIIKLSTQQKIFLPFLEVDQTNQNEMSDILYQNQENIITNELKRPRLNIDYLRGITFSNGKNQSSHESRKPLLQMLVPNKNHILRRIPKEDKYEFDRLDKKAENLLFMIEDQQEQQEIQNYKLRGEIELEIPSKNKIKAYPSQHQYQENFENLHLYKIELMGKSNCLQSYLYQVSKTKSNSIFMI